MRWQKIVEGREIMKKILFICTHNSARSQLAEGLVNHFWKEEYRASSAGTIPATVHPAAIQVLAEIGIDISGSKSTLVDAYVGQAFDLVVTVCDSAKESCPFFPRARNYIHHSFRDPSAPGPDYEDVLDHFRVIRDEIIAWLKETL